jgi:hypothetical protein
MTRVQQIGVTIAAVLIIYLLTPQSPPGVLSNAGGLAPSFNLIANAASGVVPAAAPPAAPALVGNPFTNLGLDVRSAPTITVAQIERVLAEYNSPARGHGQDIHDLGVQYGINPAVMLAFFIHESGAGSNPAWAGRKSDGTYTHNVGNIICTGSWRCYGRFRDYDSWRAGIEDWYILISELYIGEWQRTTVETIIPRYAPAADNNDEGAYIQSVRNLVQSWQGK